MMKRLILTLMAAVLGPAPVLAKQNPGWPADQIGKEKSIPFIGTIGLDDFDADGDRGVWLQDQQRRWYYATVLTPCTNLPFATRIAVDTRFNGSELDRTGSLLVDHQSCKIGSLTASNGPQPKPKKAKKG